MRTNTKVSVWMAIAASGMFLSAARPASADYVWDWSYKCGFSSYSSCKGGSGQYTSTQVAQGPTGNPYYEVTSIEGTMEDHTITALLPPKSFNLNNDNYISAFGGPHGPSAGTPYSHNPSSVVTGIGFLVDNEPGTEDNASVLEQNYQGQFVGDYTQIQLNPDIVTILNTNFSVKFSGLINPTDSDAPEPSSLSLIAVGCLIIGIASIKLFT